MADTVHSQPEQLFQSRLFIYLVMYSYFMSSSDEASRPWVFVALQEHYCVPGRIIDGDILMTAS